MSESPQNPIASSDADSPWYKMLCIGIGSAPLVDQSPMDSRGKWLAVSDWESAVGEISISVQSKATLGDCLNVVGGYEIVSTRAFELICSLRTYGNVRFCEIVVVRTAIATRERWHWMNSGGELDVVDWDRSVIIKSPLDPGPGMVYRGVLDRHKIPSCDIFYGNTDFLYVSERLRRCFEDASLKGFSFEKVEVT